MPRDRKTYSYVEEWRRRWEPELEAIAYNGATCDPTRVDPKVLHWVKQKRLDKKPHFVKIINPNAAKGRPGLLLKNSCSLTVPSPFVRQHYKQLERVVTLETTTASNPTSNEGGGGVRKWRVSFGAPKREPQWLQGWRRVAADNNFQVGDVVVFVLVEPSRFQFTHFDSHGNLNKLSVPPGKSKLEAGRCSSQESHDNEAQLRDDDATKKTKKNSKRPLVELANGPTATTVSNLLDSTKDKTKKRAVMELAMGPISTVSNVEDATQEMKKRALVVRANGSMSTLSDLEDATKETKKNRAVVELANGPMSTAGDEQVAPPVAAPILAGKSIAETSNKERRKQGKPNSEEPNHDGDNIVAVRNFVDPSFNPLGFAIKSQRRVTTVVEKERAKQAAMAQAQALTDPHFVIVLSDAHVYHDFHLVVPKSFATEAGWATSTATRVKLEDAQGECWDLLVKKNKHHEVAFHRKLWALFALHHLLEEGDVCVFHRTRPSSPRACKCTQQQIEHLGVHVVRVVQIVAHPLPLQHHFALQRL